MNSEKRGFTAVLTVCADGSRLRPWIIYKSVRDPKIKISGVYVNMQKKGYIDEEGCLNWIRTNFPLRTKEEPRRLLAWDSCATHLTGKVRVELNERNIDVVVDYWWTYLPCSTSSCGSQQAYEGQHEEVVVYLDEIWQGRVQQSREKGPIQKSKPPHG